MEYKDTEAVIALILIFTELLNILTVSQTIDHTIQTST